MKHNKKRNTAFIYETLARELTKAIIDHDRDKKQKIVSILKEYFDKGSILAEELVLYNTLLETTNIQGSIAERLLYETKQAHSQLNSKNIFGAQSKIIATINKNLGQEIWGTFVPNFKSLASISAIFNMKTPVKKKVLFEQAIIDRMSAHLNLSESSMLRPIDNLTYHSFIKKFNNKYGDVLQEQKELLNRYITSFADGGFELRLYLNEELSRLKSALRGVAEEKTEPLITQKVKDVIQYLEEFRKRDFEDSDLSKVLKTQELVQELVTNDYN